MADNNQNGARYCFTYNNPENGLDFAINGDDINAVLVQARSRRVVRGMVYQFERGANGTLHVQGCIRFDRNVRFRRCRTLLQRLMPGVHVELCNGSWADNVAYCTKDDTRVDGTESVKWGSWEPAQGRRNDIHETWMDLTERGQTFAQLLGVRPAPLIKYYKGFTWGLAERAKGDARSTPPHVIVLWGPSGYGKSHWAHHFFPTAFWMDPTNHKWWDGYTPGQPVIIDDYDGAYPYRWFLRLIDRYPMRIEVKTASTWVKSDFIVITSNRHPSEWYNSEQDEAYWHPTWDNDDYDEDAAGPRTPLARRLHEHGTVIQVDHTWRDARDNEVYDPPKKFNPETGKVE